MRGKAQTCRQWRIGGAWVRLVYCLLCGWIVSDECHREEGAARHQAYLSKHQTRPRLHLAFTGMTLLVCRLSLRVATGTPIRRLFAIVGSDKDEQAALLFASNYKTGFTGEL